MHDQSDYSMRLSYCFFTNHGANAKSSLVIANMPCITSTGITESVNHPVKLLFCEPTSNTVNREIFMWKLSLSTVVLNSRDR